LDQRGRLGTRRASAPPPGWIADAGRGADRDGDEDAEGIATPARRFSVLEITSGLPDDSREADEKQVERRLRDLRARVKLARAVVSVTPGLAEILRSDWRKAARFYVRFEITEAMFRYGAPGLEVSDNGPINPYQNLGDGLNEFREREFATFPGRLVPTPYFGVEHDVKRARVTG
jgi:hypothetical protein